MTAALETICLRPPRLAVSKIKQTARWITDPLGLMAQGQAALGDVFTIPVIGWADLVIISDPDLIKEVFIADPALLQTGKANDLMGPVLGSNSVFLLDGMTHRQVRRAIINALNLESSRCAAQFAATKAAELFAKHVNSDVRDVHQLFSAVALSTMLRLVFGSSAEPDRYRAYAKEFRLLLGGLSSYLAYLRFLQKDFGFGSPGWWIKKFTFRLQRLVQEDMQLANSDRTAPCNVIAQALQESDVPGGPSMLYDQLISLIVAGHDTVASALTWALFWILRSEDVKCTLIAELRSLSNPAELETAPFLHAVCMESLRLIPTVEIVSRYASRDFKLGPYLIPEGSFVSPSAYLLHRNEIIYPSPNSFLPSRFIGREYAAHEFMPFGGGVRRCLGSGFGVLEMKYVLHAILCNFDFEPKGIMTVSPRRRNVTIAPGRAFNVRLKARRAEALVIRA